MMRVRTGGRCFSCLVYFFDQVLIAFFDKCGHGLAHAGCKILEKCAVFLLHIRLDFFHAGINGCILRSLRIAKVHFQPSDSSGREGTYSGTLAEIRRECAPENTGMLGACDGRQVILRIRCIFSACLGNGGCPEEEGNDGDIYTGFCEVDGMIKRESIADIVSMINRSLTLLQRWIAEMQNEGTVHILDKALDKSLPQVKSQIVFRVLIKKAVSIAQILLGEVPAVMTGFKNIVAGIGGAV